MVDDGLDFLADLVTEQAFALVIGRPGTGVSTLLHRLAHACAASNVTFASWERDPELAAQAIDDERVTVLPVLSWSAADLAWRVADEVPGSIVFIDYLQLVDGVDSAGALAALFAANKLHGVVGAMATQAFAFLDDPAVAPPVVLRRVVDELEQVGHALPTLVQRLVVLHAAPHGRRVTVSGRAPELRTARATLGLPPRGSDDEP